eukprot:CAMPEP_0206591896 /NCGR_PEP_ID=MMETSP0325_2-20121206/40571_1 /ASSEMBLY_ACC=CAM_ASM_000347 /TAXON_ID=2866 /ORGANISM="Crypthecodinium cohnii, Strain Seligo" /LENGTH=47 /DNA_ID= /DNA_START= /DNA_END= /DNA_ORIENTATION=
MKASSNDGDILAQDSRPCKKERSLDPRAARTEEEDGWIAVAAKALFA